MNIFRYEFIQNRRVLIGWTLGLSFAACVFIAFLPSFMAESEALIGFMDGLGEAFTSALGLDLQLFLSAVGFYTYVFMYIILFASIQALALGMNMLSKENRMKTADFLLTKPVSRTRVYVAKLGTAAVVLLITQIVYYIVTYAALYLAATGDLDAGILLRINVSLGFIQFVFLAAGILLSQLVHKIRAVVPMAVGIGFFFFLLGMISEITGSEVIRYLSPMKYFDGNYIMVHGSYENEFVMLSIGLTVLFTGVGYVLYNRKDIPAV